MVLISKQREQLVLNLYKECKAIREIAKEVTSEKRREDDSVILSS